jgi:hypothetical protein
VEKVNNECLRQKPLQKLIRMEDHHSMSIADYSDTVIELIQAKGAHVNCATGRPKDHNESEKVPSLSSLRHCEILFIQAVPGDCNLRNAVQEILNEYLHASHWVEREPCASDQDTELPMLVFSPCEAPVFLCVSLSQVRLDRN